MSEVLEGVNVACRHHIRLITPENAELMDKEASSTWGLSPFALVEAAGRSCAAMLEKELTASSNFSNCSGGPILVCAGTGNNAADALVMLRILLENEFSNAAVLLSKFSDSAENTPYLSALKAIKTMGVAVHAWNDEKTAGLIKDAHLIIDGIAGTGIRGVLEGIPLEMLKAINARRAEDASHCCVVSVDVPSGAGSSWKSGFPVIKADMTLAIEPQKTVIYTPALRPFCGKIIYTGYIFPYQLMERYGDAELLSWEYMRKCIPVLHHDDYKYNRGVSEIYAGKTGTTGAARIAAAGASAAGSGLIRLVLDDDIYTVIASSLGGIMAIPASVKNEKFNPTALLLGPGWGRGEERLTVLEQALKAENSGTPLILDADGIFLLKKLFPDILAEEPGHSRVVGSPVFHGRAILTPHAGELEILSGIPKEQLLSAPSLIAEIAKKINAVILFKSHVMVIASPSGKLAFIDGMDPSLGAGGSGDLLAGLCTGIAARLYAAEKAGRSSFDPFAAAAAAGTLLVASSGRLGRQFYDPLKLADSAAALAGEAWLPPF